MPRTKLPPLLTEDRLVRAVSRGGMVADIGGCWRVYRSRDARARCVGRAMGHVIERLEGSGQLERRRRGRKGGVKLVWAGAAPSAAMRVPAAAVLPLMAERDQRRARKGLLANCLARAETRGEAVRIAAAGGRYRADIEQAATPQPVTMRWDAAPVSGGRSANDTFGPGGRAMAAAARLRQLGRALDTDTLKIVDEVLIRGASAAGLARLLSISRPAAVARADAALCTLAEAYDLRVKGV